MAGKGDKRVPRAEGMTLAEYYARDRLAFNRKEGKNERRKTTSTENQARKTPDGR